MPEGDAAMNPNPIKEALANWKAASSSVEGFRALLRTLREMTPKLYDDIFDNGGFSIFLTDGNPAKIDARFVDFWVDRAIERTKAFEMELTDAEKAEWESALASLRVFLLEKGARNGFPRNPENLDMKSAGKRKRAGKRKSAGKRKRANKRKPANKRKRANKRGGECVARKEVALGAEGEAASSQVDGLPAKGVQGIKSAKGTSALTAIKEEIHRSPHALCAVFKKHGSNTRIVGDVTCAHFCPDCDSKQRGKNARPCVTMGYNHDHKNNRYTWTCQKCHKRGSHASCGDAIEAEGRFQGRRGPFYGSDFAELVNTVAAIAGIPNRSAIQQNLAPPHPQALSFQYRWPWERILLRARMPLPAEFICMLFAACVSRCPETPLEFAKEVAKYGVKRDTARRIAWRWYKKDRHIFKNLSDARTERERHRILLAAAYNGVFLAWVAVAAAMLYYCIRDKGTNTEYSVSVYLLSCRGKYNESTVSRCLDRLRCAGVFSCKFVSKSKRLRGNGPVIECQRKLFLKGSPNLAALRSAAKSIRKDWEDMVDKVGRRVRWSLKRFVESLSKAQAPPSLAEA